MAKTTTAPHNPFTPGSGSVPPRLAGRDSELAILAEAMSALREHRAPTSNFIVTAPRGFGKTALLESHLRLWRNQKNAPRVISLTPDKIDSVKELRRAVLGMLRRVSAPQPSALKAWAGPPLAARGTCSTPPRP